MSDSDWYKQIKDVFVCSTIAMNIFVIIFQIPWIVYLIINISQREKILTRLKRNGYQLDDVSLVSRHRNKLLLYKYLLMCVIFELLVFVLNVFNSALGYIAIKERIQLNSNHLIEFAHFYVKYLLVLIEIIFAQCNLEMSNLTTLFVKDVYLRNSAHSGMRKKINRFVLRFLLVLGLGVSGVGLGIAYVICEVFLITQLVLYYRYSRQLYRALRMHYEDTKYEFGSTSVEARTVWRHMRHYKWCTIWYYIIVFCYVVVITIFELSFPLQFLNEASIKQILINNNITFTNTTVYQYLNIAPASVSIVFSLILLLSFLPIYTVYSMYYLCDKFLFVRVYKHRYHVNDNWEIESLVQPLMKK